MACWRVRAEQVLPRGGTIVGSARREQDRQSDLPSFGLPPRCCRKEWLSLDLAHFKRRFRCGSSVLRGCGRLIKILLRASAGFSIACHENAAKTSAHRTYNIITVVRRRTPGHQKNSGCKKKIIVCEIGYPYKYMPYE